MSILSSLSNRIFLASALLAVVSIAAAVSLVNFVATRRAETELERSLDEAGQLVTQFQSLLFQHLVREARLIADLPRLKAAVYESDAPTARPVAAEYQSMIEADLLVITNRAGLPLAVLGNPGVPAAEIGGRDSIRAALAGSDHVALWSSPDELLQVVTVPIVLESEVLGTLSAGVSLSRRLADRIKLLTRSEVVFFDQGRVLASTLPADSNTTLEPVARRDGITHVAIRGHEYVALRRPLSLDSSLTQSAARPPPSASTPLALVLLSRTEHLAFLRTLHSGLALTAVVAVLLATLLSYAVARTITRPVRALTADMREMAATGNLTLPPPRASSRWEDEDARLLTGTFETLTAALGRFQREAAQRERLSSLGRLSTVIAHEVRNPLMIIKASLRALRRGARDPEEMTRAVSDIEGEVVRLNRLVNDVLDYARPLTFTREPVDLDRLLADAVQATQAGQTDPAIHLAATNVGEVLVDGDRLRQALVNILSNAREACATRLSGQPEAATGSAAGGPGAEPMVEVHAARGDGDASVEIVVRDRGTGIAATDLVRIFEPFFTTKQTGSGIGLAITRNIIEGLGGTIGVESAAGRGTTVRVVLPRGEPGAAAAARPA